MPEATKKAPAEAPKEPKAAKSADAAGKVDAEAKKTADAAKAVVAQPQASVPDPEPEQKQATEIPAWMQNRKRKPENILSSKTLRKFALGAALIGFPIQTISAGAAYKTYDLLRKAPVLRTVDSKARSIVKENVVDPGFNAARAAIDAPRTLVENTAKTVVVRPGYKLLLALRDIVHDATNAMKQKIGLKDHRGNPIGLPGLMLFEIKNFLFHAIAAPFRTVGKIAHFVHVNPGWSLVGGLLLLGAQYGVQGGIVGFAGGVAQLVLSSLQALAVKLGGAAALGGTAAPTAAPAAAGWLPSWLVP